MNTPKLTKQEKKWRAEGDAYTLASTAEIQQDPDRMKAADAAGKRMAAETKKSAKSQVKRAGFMENLSKAFGGGTKGKVGTAKKVAKKAATTTTPKVAKKVAKKTAKKVTKKVQAAQPARPAKAAKVPRPPKARAKKAATKK